MNFGIHNHRNQLIALLLASVVFAAAALMLLTPGENSISPGEAHGLVRNIGSKISKGDFVSAYHDLNLAQGVFRRTGDSTGLFNSSVSIALIYEVIGQEQMAYSTLRSIRPVNLASMTKSVQNYCSMMAHYSAQYGHDTRRAIYYNSFLKQHYARAGALDSVKGATANEAEIYILGGDYARARATLKSLSGVTSESTLSEMNYCNGVIALHDGNLDSAALFLAASVDNSRTMTVASNAIASLRLLTQIERQRRNLDRSLQYRDRLDSMENRLRSSTINYQIAIQTEQFKMSLAEHKARREKTIHRMGIVILLLTVIFLAVVVFALHRNNKAQRQIAELEIRRANAERHRAETDRDLARVEKELAELKQHNSEQQLHEVYEENNAIIRQLTFATDREQKLHQMEHTLITLHGDFLSRVEKLYPSLSPGERRLMGFIYMDIPSQDIAALLNISMASLHTSRYRLRKKLKLVKDDDLVAFIKSL